MSLIFGPGDRHAFGYSYARYENGAKYGDLQLGSLAVTKNLGADASNFHDSEVVCGSPPPQQLLP